MTLLRLYKKRKPSQVRASSGGWALLSCLVSLSGRLAPAANEEGLSSDGDDFGEDDELMDGGESDEGSEEGGAEDDGDSDGGDADDDDDEDDDEEEGGGGGSKKGAKAIGGMGQVMGKILGQRVDKVCARAPLGLRRPTLAHLALPTPRNRSSRTSPPAPPTPRAPLHAPPRSGPGARKANHKDDESYAGADCRGYEDKTRARGEARAARAGE